MRRKVVPFNKWKMHSALSISQKSEQHALRRGIITCALLSVFECSTNSPSSLLFAPVDVDDLVLIHVLEYMGGVHEDADRAHCGHDEEHVELQSIHHHGHKLPVFSYLK